MNTLSLSIIVDRNHPADFFVCHSTTKYESVELSTFQRIGLALQEADLIAYRIVDNPYAAKAKLTADLINAGLEKYEAAKLLSASSWEDRMSSAWEALSLKERTVASTLDYEIYQNYWPNLKFADSH